MMTQFIDIYAALGRDELMSRVKLTYWSLVMLSMSVKEAPYSNYKLQPVDEAEALRHKLSLWQLNWFSLCLVALAMIPQINGQSGTPEEDLEWHLATPKKPFTANKFIYNKRISGN